MTLIEQLKHLKSAAPVELWRMVAENAPDVEAKLRGIAVQQHGPCWQAAMDGWYAGVAMMCMAWDEFGSPDDLEHIVASARYKGSE